MGSITRLIGFINWVDIGHRGEIGKLNNREQKDEIRERTVQAMNLWGGVLLSRVKRPQHQERG